MQEVSSWIGTLDNENENENQKERRKESRKRLISFEEKKIEEDKGNEVVK